MFRDLAGPWFRQLRRDNSRDVDLQQYLAHFVKLRGLVEEMIRATLAARNPVIIGWMVRNHDDRLGPIAAGTQLLQHLKAAAAA